MSYKLLHVGGTRWHQALCFAMPACRVKSDVYEFGRFSPGEVVSFFVVLAEGMGTKPSETTSSLGRHPEVPSAVPDGGSSIEKEASIGQCFTTVNIAVVISRRSWDPGFAPPAPTTACNAWMSIPLIKLYVHFFEFFPCPAANLPIASTRKTCPARLFAPGNDMATRVSARRSLPTAWMMVV